MPKTSSVRPVVRYNMTCDRHRQTQLVPAVGRFRLLTQWPGTLPSQILSRIPLAAQTVLGVHLKRTCLRDTSASSALRVLLNDNALYYATHSLTRRTAWRRAVIK